MARFLIRSVISTIVTMLLVSIALFFLLEVGSGDITVKILGVFATPEQRASIAPNWDWMRLPGSATLTGWPATIFAPRDMLVTPSSQPRTLSPMKTNGGLMSMVN